MIILQRGGEKYEISKGSKHFFKRSYNETFSGK